MERCIKNITTSNHHSLHEEEMRTCLSYGRSYFLLAVPFTRIDAVVEVMRYPVVESVISDQ